MGLPVSIRPPPTLIPEPEAVEDVEDLLCWRISLSGVCETEPCLEALFSNRCSELLKIDEHSSHSSLRNCFRSFYAYNLQFSKDSNFTIIVWNSKNPKKTIKLKNSKVERFFKFFAKVYHNKFVYIVIFLLDQKHNFIREIAVWKICLHFQTHALWRENFTWNSILYICLHIFKCRKTQFSNSSTKCKKPLNFCRKLFWEIFAVHVYWVS